MMKLRMGVRLKLSIGGGMSESILPRVESLLNQSEYMNALDHVAKRKNQHRYKSVIDFVLCEAMPQFQDGCFAYYEGEGPPLRDLQTPEEIRKIESILLVFLSIAYHYYCDDRKIGWSRTRLETLRFLERNA